LEDTVSDLQAQIARLNASVRQWLDARDQLEPMQQRLSQVTERCNDILNRWTATDERHAHAVAEVEARLGEWSAIENRLQQESVQRIRDLERRIEHEWKTLREVNEAPAQQLREQATALGETCVAAANLALRSFERAEARFAALENDLQERLNQLSRDVQAAVAELREQGAGRRPAIGSNVEPFPLDGVMRIHEGLRDADGGAAKSAAPGRQLSTTAVALADGSEHDVNSVRDRLRSAESGFPRRAPDVLQLPTSGAHAEGAPAELHRHETDGSVAAGFRRYVLVLAGIIVATAIGIGFFVQRTLSARLDEAAARATAAERQSQSISDAAARQIASTRADADRQIAEARQTAQRAEIVSNVLTAPDLIRFNLVASGGADASYAQLLWSRTRGMVLSGGHVAAPPPGSTYQLWLLTDADPVSGGTFVPDATGRVTLAIDPVPKVPRRVTGAEITLEPSGGAPAPSGPPVLARAQD